MARDGLPGVLFIGCGNELRGDDAVGLLAAQALAERGFEALAVPQLTPELAEQIAASRAVIFLDADAALPPGKIALDPLPPVQPAQPFEHHASPAGLLRLAHIAYGAEPAAWLIRIGVASFDFGAALSAPAQAAVPRAVEAAVALTAPL